MITSTPAVLKVRREARLCRRNGTAATNGQPVVRTRRGKRTTTCELDSITDGRVEAARLWVLATTGKPQHKKDFIADACNAAVKALADGNPKFALPPWCAFPPP